MKTADKEYNEIKSRIDHLKIDSVRFIVDAGWCSDRIAWAYKFKKINEQQKDELCDKMIELYKTASACHL